MRVVDRQVWFWLAALALLIAGIALLRDILLPFVAGIVIAYFLNPAAERLQRLGLGRTAAAVLIVGLLAVVVSLAAVFLVPMLANQLKQLATDLPGDVQKIRAAVEAFARDRLGSQFPAFQAGMERAIGELTQNWASSAGTILASIWIRGLALVNLVSLLLITPVVVFYLLVDWHPLLERVDVWLPRAHAPTIRRLAGEVNDAVSAFIRGQGAICLLLGLFYAVGLTWIGVPYGLLIGLVTGLLGFVPIIGWVIGLIAATTVALLDQWPNYASAFKAAGVLLAGMALDTAILSPRFVGRKVGLHPVWMIFALMAFTYLFGLVGTLVAVPVAAAIGVLVRFALTSYLDSSFYDDTIRPAPERREARR